MRVSSTPESALNGEITVLAIVECAASVAIYVGVGMYFGTLEHLAVAVALAPLMLFRTEFSAEWGLQVYARLIDQLSKLPDPFSVIAYLTVGTIAGPAIRFVATAYWTLRRPLQTLKETPRNWMRQTLCTDIAHPPEIIPMEATRGEAEPIPTFRKYVSALTEKDDSLALKIGFFIVSSPLLVIGWIPSLFYRVSFKATAIAYTPFIWVVHGTLRNPLPVKARLKRITQSELEKVRRGVSWIIIMTLAAKIGLMRGWVELSYIEEKFPGQRLVQRLVDPDMFPWWQITLGMDALLTFFLLFFADAALARIEEQQPWPENRVFEIVSSVSFLRAGLSIMTILHFFYIAVVEVAGGILGLPGV